MLQKVDPAKGIPHFRNIYVSNIKAVGVKRIISAAGLNASLLENFQFDKIDIEANTMGTIDFAQGWKITNSKLKATDNKPISVTNSLSVQTGE
jgi:hypothetical protein